MSSHREFDSERASSSGRSLFLVIAGIAGLALLALLLWHKLTAPSARPPPTVAAPPPKSEDQNPKSEPPPPAPVAPKQTFPEAGQPWENALGMKFAPVPGTDVLFSIWDTRVQDYEKFASATQREWPKPNFEQGPTHPAVNVSWEDAQGFCAWLTKKEQAEGRLGPGQKYRLPTDAEWSVAVELDEPRGGTPKSKNGQIKGIYPWGTQLPPPRGAGNYSPNLNVDDFAYTSPVGSFAANRFGLYDMGGNVWQWCEDDDGSSGKRVLRGVSYANSDSDYLLSSFRLFSSDYRLEVFGFRCVVAVASPP